MSFTYSQTPAYLSLTQSPTVLSIKWDGYATSSDFQYVCDLYYWTGSQSQRPTTSQYTLVKYPNSDGTGIFDFSRILNSTLNAPNEAPGDNTKWFTYDVYFQYLSGSTYVTGSHSGVFTDEYLAMDGYQLFGQPLQGSASGLSYSGSFSRFFPVLTDGPATQSVYYDCEDNFYQNDLAPGVVFYQPNHAYTNNGIIVTGFQVGLPEKNFTWNASYNTASFDTGSNGVIQKVQIDPTTINGYLQTYTTQSLAGATYYTIDFFNGNGSLYGRPIRYEIQNLQKYPNVQIMWKNRYGEMDYFNFNMVSRESFNVSRSQYQPQIGSWNSSTLTYKNYENSIANYLVDAGTSLLVNTFWISEDYNNIFKQLLVTDEIYWIYDPVAHKLDSNEGIRPMTIKTSNVQFKTGVVDKLIQYSFEFDYGQAYKLIL